MLDNKLINKITKQKTTEVNQMNSFKKINKYSSNRFLYLNYISLDKKEKNVYYSFPIDFNFRFIKVINGVLTLEVSNSCNSQKIIVRVNRIIYRRNIYGIETIKSMVSFNYLQAKKLLYKTLILLLKSKK